jgi:hypothetical protein
MISRYFSSFFDKNRVGEEKSAYRKSRLELLFPSRNSDKRPGTARPETAKLTGVINGWVAGYFVQSNPGAAIRKWISRPCGLTISRDHKPGNL